MSEFSLPGIRALQTKQPLPPWGEDSLQERAGSQASEGSFKPLHLSGVLSECISFKITNQKTLGIVLLKQLVMVLIIWLTKALRLKTHVYINMFNYCKSGCFKALKTGFNWLFAFPLHGQATLPVVPVPEWCAVNLIILVLGGEGKYSFLYSTFLTFPNFFFAVPLSPMSCFSSNIFEHSPIPKGHCSLILNLKNEVQLLTVLLSYHGPFDTCVTLQQWRELTDCLLK